MLERSIQRSIHVILICFVYHSNFVQLSMFKYFFLEKNHHLSEDFKIYPAKSIN